MSEITKLKFFFDKNETASSFLLKAAIKILESNLNNSSLVVIER